jgi:ATP-binding cassette subfamily B (MDR/TAP) protein 1
MGLLIQFVVTVVVSLGIALRFSWSLTLIILSSLPIIVGIVAMVAPRMQRNINLEKTHLSHAASHLIRAVTAITTVKIFNAQSQEIARFDTILNLASTAYLRLAQINGIQQGIVRFVVLAMFVQGFWYGGSLVQKGELQAGNVIMVFWAALMSVTALQNISPMLIIIEKGKVASAELSLLLPQNQQSQPEPETKKVGDIEFKNVCFPTLSDIGFIRISRTTRLSCPRQRLVIPSITRSHIHCGHLRLRKINPRRTPHQTLQSLGRNHQTR